MSTKHRNVSNPSPHVLFLCSWYPVPENPSHGIFIRNHAIALSAFLPVTTVYAYSCNISQTELTSAKENQLHEIFIRYPKTRCKIPIVKQWMQYCAFKKAYQKGLYYLLQNNIQISHIQLNVVYPAALVLNNFIKTLKTPYTIVEHWSGYLKEDGNYKGFLQKYITQKTIRNTDKLWHVSEPQKKAMLSHQLNGPYELLYNAVNTNVFNPLNLQKFNATTFLHVSSLTEREKNLAGTFTALKNLQNKNYAFNLIVIGGNDETTRHAKQLQASLSLQNVTFLGHQNPEIISNYMNRCHALLLFSFFEGMPVVALEALACGLPVFASEVGQLPYIIQEGFGKLVKTNHTHEFSEQLALFMEDQLIINSKSMVEFIEQHASYKAVGSQMAKHYLQNFNAG